MMSQFVVCSKQSNLCYQNLNLRGLFLNLTRKPKISDDEIIPSHRSASVAKDHFFDDSPVVKSPPEPTRVKSPEQLNMRSPDPVNWTVPLDTGKTFTVTQNVKSGEYFKMVMFK